jgi:hypothetical protein
MYSASVRLLLGSNAIVTGSVNPSTTTTEPNGSGCGECTNAFAAVSVN